MSGVGARKLQIGDRVSIRRAVRSVNAPSLLVKAGTAGVVMGRPYGEDDVVIVQLDCGAILFEGQWPECALDFLDSEGGVHPRGADPPAEPPKAMVIDIMAALKRSLARRQEGSDE